MVPSREKSSEDTQAADPEERLLVGRILRAHATDGEVKVVPETDDPTRFEAFETLFLGTSPEEADAYAVEGVRFQETKRGLLVLLKLDDVGDRNAAEKLRRLNVYAQGTDLPALEEGEMFIHDLVGLTVVTEERQAIGTVEDVLQSSAHDVFVIAREGRPSAMIPAVEDFVLDVDLSAGQITIRPIEGMLE